MPFISVKCYPRDREMHEKLAEALYDCLVETWGLKPHQVNIAIENVEREDWPEKVREPLIEGDMEHMFYKDGEKLF